MLGTWEVYIVGDLWSFFFFFWSGGIGVFIGFGWLFEIGLVLVIGGGVLLLVMV